MDKLQQCGLSFLKKEVIDWVQCTTCGAWYHCVCIGIAQEFFHEHGHEFFCCKTSVDSSRFVTLETCYIYIYKGSLYCTTIIELVDSICRDGANKAHPFSHIEWPRTPKHGSYKSF